MITTRNVLGLVLGLTLAASPAGAQAGAQGRRACPSCDSVAAERERARTVAALVTELAQHHMTLARLQQSLGAVDSLTAGERRELDSRVVAIQGSIARAERSLLERCGADPGLPRGSIGAVFMTDSLSRTRHPVVYSVTPGSPAFRAGMVPGDTIIMINGRDARMQIEARTFLEPGNTVDIRVLRQEGEPHDMRVSVAPRPGLLGGGCGVPGAFVFTRPTPARGGGGTVVAGARSGVIGRSAPLPGARAMGGRTSDSLPTRVESFYFGPSIFGVTRGGQVLAGADLHMLNDGLRGALALAPTDTGALVITVDSTLPAGVSGLRSGDVIVRAGGQKVRSLDVIVRAVLNATARRVQLDVLRAPAAGPGRDVRGQKREEVAVMLRW